MFRELYGRHFEYLGQVRRSAPKVLAANAVHYEGITP